MDVIDVAEIAREALFQVIIVGGPVLVISVIVGLVISIIQTAFSIQEQTLTFVPKIFAILLTIALLSTTMAVLMQDYTLNLFERIPEIVRATIIK